MFLFSYFKFFEYIMQLLLACIASADKYADSLTGISLYITSCFSLPAFKILSLALNLTFF